MKALKISTIVLLALILLSGMTKLSFRLDFLDWLIVCAAVVCCTSLLFLRMKKVARIIFLVFLFLVIIGISFLQVFIYSGIFYKQRYDIGSNETIKAYRVITGFMDSDTVFKLYRGIGWLPLIEQYVGFARKSNVDYTYPSLKATPRMYFHKKLIVDYSDHNGVQQSDTLYFLKNRHP